MEFPSICDCGAISNIADPSWRWNGASWEHRCSGMHPQVGHLVARSLKDICLDAILDSWRKENLVSELEARRVWDYVRRNL